ncbi:alpha-ketoacid dehydrogenase kinase [Neoconidiobolus thromboides FSU 785]|nr:alpha-ketoacid dehydrogenase kinase [Neoconidiobolus thromboides FSU 785]
MYLVKKSSSLSGFLTKPPSRWNHCNKYMRLNQFSTCSKLSYNEHGFYINQVLDTYTGKEIKKLTLRQLIFFGRNLNEERLLTSANYVRTELPVRIAHRIKDFQNLPFKVGINPYIQEAYQLYWEAFDQLKKIRNIDTLDKNIEFCKILNGLLKEHLVVISKLSLGMAECSPYLPPERIDGFMHKALTSRIARRVVAEQHIALTSQFQKELIDNSKVGIVSINCDSLSTIKKCSKLALKNVVDSFTCSSGGKVLPKEVIPQLIINNETKAGFPFVQDHIEYVLFEVLKNAYKATISHALSTPDSSYRAPPIQVAIAEGSEEVAIRISDLGGGIPLNYLSSLFSFSRCDQERRNALGEFPKLTAKVDMDLPITHKLNKEELQQNNLATQFSKTCFSKLGMGLPVSRITMQYWGGNLNINTLPGLGTDVYLRFPNSRIGAKEHLAFDPPMLDQHYPTQTLAAAVAK